MSQREELGCRFSVRPGIGNDDPFAGLPFLADTGKIAGAGMGAHAQSDEFLMGCQDLETLPGCPEHQVGVAERQGMPCEFGSNPRCSSAMSALVCLPVSRVPQRKSRIVGM